MSGKKRKPIQRKSPIEVMIAGRTVAAKQPDPAVRGGRPLRFGVDGADGERFLTAGKTSASTSG
jgi:hypothetical protein